MATLGECPCVVHFDTNIPVIPLIAPAAHDGSPGKLDYEAASRFLLSDFPSLTAFHASGDAFKEFCARYYSFGPFAETLLVTLSNAAVGRVNVRAQLAETLPPCQKNEAQFSIHMLYALARERLVIHFPLEGLLADGELANTVCAVSPTALINRVSCLAQSDVSLMQRLRYHDGDLELSPAEIKKVCHVVMMPGDVIASDRVCRAIASVLSNQARKDQVNCSKSATDAAAEKKRMGQTRDRQNRGDAEVHGRPAISRDRSRSPLDRRTKRAEQQVSCVQKSSRTAPRYTASDSVMPSDAARREMAALQRKERLQRRRLCRGASPGAETPEPESPPPPKQRAAAPSHSKRKRSVSPPHPAAISPQPKRRAPAPEAPAVKAPQKHRAPVSPPPAAKASPQQPKRRMATPEAPQVAPAAVRKSGRERKQRMDLKQVEAEVGEASPPQKIVAPKQIIAPLAPVPQPTPMTEPTLLMIDPTPSGNKGEKQSLPADASSPALANSFTNSDDFADEQPQDNIAMPTLSSSSASQPIPENGFPIAVADHILQPSESQSTSTDRSFAALPDFERKDDELLQLKEAFTLIIQRGLENIDEPMEDVMMEDIPLSEVQALIRSSTQPVGESCHYCGRCFATIRGQRIHAAKVHGKQLRQSAILDEIAKRASAGLPPLRRSKRLQEKTLEMAENRTR